MHAHLTCYLKNMRVREKELCSSKENETKLLNILRTFFELSKLKTIYHLFLSLLPILRSEYLCDYR
jgi:hypothetical protein